MDLRPKSYDSAADDGEASVMAVQAHTGVTIATNVCEEALPRCCSVVTFRVLPSR